MMTNSFDDEDVDIVPEVYYQEVMFDKVNSRTEITCDPLLYGPMTTTLQKCLK